MMDLQAAIGMHQIKRVEQYWKRRLEIWNRYNQAFVGLPLGLPARFDPNSRHALHLYTILVDEKRSPVGRDKFMKELHARNIGSGVHYRAIPVHPVYQRLFGWKPENFPNAIAIGQTTVSLPLSAKLTDEDVDDVIAAVKDVVNATS